MDDIDFEQLRIVFERDDDCADPLEDHDDLTLVSFHPHYGNRHGFNDADELKRYARESNCRLFPVYCYDHSGLAFSLEPFSCGWDSGLYGYLVATRSIVDEFKGNKKTPLKKYVRAVLEEYDTWQRGDCWCYRILDRHGNELDSCRGYIGEDWCKDAAIDAAQQERARIEKARQHRVKQFIRHRVPLNQRKQIMEDFT
ncbi:hypothetical protein GCM10023116_48000 [Kistimonas scapharcae]|uniref:Uncharacterized protein n=1 Tax=Kistimonas scapharcae TaxID=1036133 RepID=A0ABP8V9Y2_9GAMM